MTSLAESYAHATAVLGGDLWGDPTEAEMRRMDADRERQRAECRNARAGQPCSKCCHNACGWCDECSPEVPQWT